MTEQKAASIANFKEKRKIKDISGGVRAKVTKFPHADGIF